MKKYIFKKNPIPEILSNEDFSNLEKWGLLSHIEIRDYLIRKEYGSLKAAGILTKERLSILSKKHKLGINTIQKIIYK